MIIEPFLCVHKLKSCYTYFGAISVMMIRF